MNDKEKIAVFIDADNAPANKIDKALSELARYGVVNIRKAYGNWKSTKLKPCEDILHDFAIQPIQQFDLTKGKNATDMALVNDVMDVLISNHLWRWFLYRIREREGRNLQSKQSNWTNLFMHPKWLFGTKVTY